MMALLLLLACQKETESTPKPDPQESSPPVDSDSGHSDSPPPPNNPPGSAEISLSPEVPQPGEPLIATVITPAVDPDSDEVSYLWSWTVNGVDAGISSDTVDAGLTSMLDTWAVTVTPFDGEDVGPTSTLSILVGNQAPSVPGIALTPTDAIEGETISLIIDPPAIDPDGDPLTTTITWYDDEAEVDWLAGLTEMDGRYVDDQDQIRVVVSVTDGFHEPVTAEASMTVHYTCTRLPNSNIGDTTITTATAYHGLDFTDDGALIGVDGVSLFKSYYDGTRELWIPGMQGIQQIDRLPDGDYVLGDGNNGRLIRLTSSGGTSTISASVGSVYGVMVGPDGMVYTASGNKIQRTDPSSGTTTDIWEADRNTRWSAHSINFNLDSTALYIGTIGSGGEVYTIDLDALLEPISAPYLYASGVGGGYHDGLELDECGNLYVADYTTRGFYRVDSAGNVISFVNIDMSKYGHGAAWGNGVGGWRDDAIYQPQPYNGNTIREVVIGFKSGDTVRTWNGIPVSY